MKVRLFNLLIQNRVGPDQHISGSGENEVTRVDFLTDVEIPDGATVVGAVDHGAGLLEILCCEKAE